MLHLFSNTRVALGCVGKSGLATPILVLAMGYNQLMYCCSSTNVCPPPGRNPNVPHVGKHIRAHASAKDMVGPAVSEKLGECS